MVVYVKIHQGPKPILRAKVTALIESVDGKTVTLELLDNGAGNHPRKWTHFSFPGNNQATEGGRLWCGAQNWGCGGRARCLPATPVLQMLGNMSRACL